MKYEQNELNSQSRNELPGKFVELSHGYVHYEFEGSENGPLVILVHGFSSPLFVWDFTFKDLISAGFRVLRYDLYGRGYSDRPRVKYNLELFVQQLSELILVLGLPKVNLVGLSMGGGISALFAEQNPELVEKLVLIDSIGLPTEKRLFPIILEIPLINRLAVMLFGHKRILESQKEDFTHYDADKIEGYLKKFSKQMEYKGFLRAIRSTVISVPFTGLVEVFKNLGRSDLPIQLFWGKNDPLIPYSTSQKFCELIPTIQFYTIKDCGHMPQYAKPEELNPWLISFLRNF